MKKKHTRAQQFQRVQHVKLDTVYAWTRLDTWLCMNVSAREWFKCGQYCDVIHLSHCFSACLSNRIAVGRVTMQMGENRWWYILGTTVGMCVCVCECVCVCVLWMFLTKIVGKDLWIGSLLFCPKRDFIGLVLYSQLTNNQPVNVVNIRVWITTYQNQQQICWLVKINEEWNGIV